MKVGRDYIESPKRRKFAYRDVKFDPDGWADASQFLPADFDLMFLKIKGKPSVSGWAVGGKWDGLKLNADDEILYWKKKPEEVVRQKS